MVGMIIMSNESTIDQSIRIGRNGLSEPPLCFLNRAICIATRRMGLIEEVAMART